MRQPIAILCGGPSVEHDVSLASAARIEAALKSRGDVILVTVDRDGERWAISDAGNGTPSDALAHLKRRGAIALIAMHGTYGEDGTVQQLLEDAGIPYTGSGPAASALAMDKVRSADVFRNSGLRVPETLPWSVKTPEDHRAFLQAIPSRFQFPVVVKPSNLGSSVGVSIALDAHALEEAIAAAAHVSTSLIAQEHLRGREVTCGVMDDGDPTSARALPVTEIIPQYATFFDYTAKYAPGGSREITPAALPPTATAAVQAAAITAHRCLGCTGVSRTDIILVEGIPYILETNTIPGLTTTSLLPQAAAAAGITFDVLIDRMVAAALHRWRATVPSP
ncbi:MAG: D-alanine--D-alanine ligase [bacterium]|nr:D-alanine--D-alanine ligase [bacterium]